MNRDSQGKRSNVGTKNSDMSSRNINARNGNVSETHIKNNSGINSGKNGIKNVKSTILAYRSPKNKESAKSIENIR
jgi:hypothetical protein